MAGDIYHVKKLKKPSRIVRIELKYESGVGDRCVDEEGREEYAKQGRAGVIDPWWEGAHSRN